MRQIIDYINEVTRNENIQETSGNTFKEQVKYSKSDWEKYKKTCEKDVWFGNYENNPDLELVYIPNHKDKIMDHIATYNKKKEVLWCDDIKIFGHEIK